MFALVFSLVAVGLSSAVYLDRPDAFAKIIKHEKPITNWGGWGNWDFCPNGTFAAGFSAQIERDLGIDDDSGLNTVELCCVKEGDFPAEMPKKCTPWGSAITSKAGYWGRWPDAMSACVNSYIVGFKVEGVENRGKKDDYGATSFAVRCSNGKDMFAPNSEDYSATTKPSSDWKVYWQPWALCPEGSAICGMRTQVEDKQTVSLLGKWSVDNSALNNVEAKCCPLSAGVTKAPEVPMFTLADASCVVKEERLRIFECINKQADGKLKCTFTLTSGTKLGANADANVIALVGKMREALKAAYKRGETIYNWEAANSRDWAAARPFEVFIEADPLTEAYGYQLVGTCGEDIKVFTQKIYMESSRYGGQRKADDAKVTTYFKFDGTSLAVEQ